MSPGYDFCLSCGTKFSEMPPKTKKRGVPPEEKEEKKKMGGCEILVVIIIILSILGSGIITIFAFLGGI